MYCYICKEISLASSYHKFPKNPEVRKEWLDAFGFEEIDVMPGTKICNKHFLDSCFVIHNARKSLKRGAVPTLLLRKRRKSGIRKVEHNTANNMRNKILDSQLGETTYALNKNFLVYKVPINAFQSQSATESVRPLNIKNNIEEYTEQVKVADISKNSNRVSVDSTHTESQIVPKKRQIWCPARVGQIDIQYGFDTPRAAKTSFTMVLEEMNSLKNKVNMLDQEVKRLNKNVKHLQSILDVKR